MGVRRKSEDLYDSVSQRHAIVYCMLIDHNCHNIPDKKRNAYSVGVRGIMGIPINRDAVWKRYVSRYGLVVSVHSGIFVSFRKSKWLRFFGYETAYAAASPAPPRHRGISLPAYAGLRRSHDRG